MTTATRTILLLLACIALACASIAGTITLKADASLARAGEVTLADVATLDGAEAEALGGVSLGEVGSRREISLDQVRAALDAHKVNWGRLALRGSSCAVRVASPAAIVRTDDSAPQTAVQRPGVETVRDRVLATLRELFGAEPEAIRVAFDDGGRGVLSTPVRGHRVDVETSSASSSRLAIRVWMYDGDRLALEGSVRADVSLLVDTFTLSTAVGRGDRIDASMLTKATLWMSPTGAPPIRDEAQAVGAVARTRLDAGTVLRTEHVEAPLVIERGDLVTVHALAGAMIVKTKARALADAREGEMVELSRGRETRPFLARAAAPGLAILEAAAAPQGADR